jgi:hypothetical protein
MDRDHSRANGDAMTDDETRRASNRPRHPGRRTLDDPRPDGRGIGAMLHAFYEAGPLSEPLPQHILDLLIAIEADGKREALAPTSGPEKQPQR